MTIEIRKYCDSCGQEVKHPSTIDIELHSGQVYERKEWLACRTCFEYMERALSMWEWKSNADIHRDVLQSGEVG